MYTFVTNLSSIYRLGFLKESRTSRFHTGSEMLSFSPGMTPTREPLGSRPLFYHRALILYPIAGQFREASLCRYSGRRLDKMGQNMSILSCFIRLKFAQLEAYIRLNICLSFLLGHGYLASGRCPFCPAASRSLRSHSSSKRKTL